MNKTTYLGVKIYKNPLDAWIYQELIFAMRPDIIIEIGNAYGGSTLFLAHILDFIGQGKVIGLDLSHKSIPAFIKKHRRIHFIEGDACINVGKVKNFIGKNDKVLIIEDSAHTYENTLSVLRTYAPLVTKGSYFIVEDSICHHGLNVGPNPGPWNAIEAFMEGNHDFVIDRERESFVITYNPRGFLKRI